VVDSLSFFVKERQKQEQEQDKALTEQAYVRVQNVIADLSGVIYIDQKNNKSGHKRFPQYPIFDSKSESYVYFDKPQINSGLLKRDQFFYVVDPFQLDSLDDFSTDNLKFAGYLNSANIFPSIDEPLVVMNDYSLGFDHLFPEDGFPMFGDKGKFYKRTHLSNEGFLGDGSLTYLTSISYADTFMFYPDSVTALARRFEMKADSTGITFPMAEADSIGFVLSLIHI